MSNQDYLKVAIKAAKQSGPIFRKYFGKPKKVISKSKDFANLVTEVDLKIEKAIRQSIGKHFPEHIFLGEETGANPRANTNDYTWIVDPIDGTTNFIHGIPFCCISIALWHKQKPLVAIVYNPITNESFTAIAKQGSFKNGKKIKVSGQKYIKSAYGGFGWGKEIKAAKYFFPFIKKNSQKIRTFGAAAWEICMVASGIFDFHLQTKFSLWDFAAAALIVQEAGGRITDLRGNDIGLKTTSVIASNGKIHKELLKIIR